MQYEENVMDDHIKFDIEFIYINGELKPFTFNARSLSCTVTVIIRHNLLCHEGFPHVAGVGSAGT